MYATLAVNPYRRSNEAIEGPTRRQALRMAAYRQRLLADAEAALAKGEGERAFDLDCAALDIEADLTRYGFDHVTGKPATSKA